MHPSAEIEHYWVLRAGSLSGICIDENVNEPGAMPRFRVRLNGVPIETTSSFMEAVIFGGDHLHALFKLKGN